MSARIHNADWHAASQELIQHCVELDTVDERIRLLEKLCELLGQNLYPAFLHILCTIEQCGDVEAKQIITETLVYGLTTGRLPSGSLPAWGSTHSSTLNPFGQSRTLGPIEFICAWYSQSTNLPPLTTQNFRSCLVRLIGLISTNPGAKDNYCSKLLVDTGDPLGGSLSSRTREGLSGLAGSWINNLPTQLMVDDYVNIISQNSKLAQMSNAHRFAHL